MNVYQFGRMSIDPQRVWEHKGHKIEIETYGTPPDDLAIECVTCYEVIADIVIVVTDEVDE